MSLDGPRQIVSTYLAPMGNWCTLYLCTMGIPQTRRAMDHHSPVMRMLLYAQCWRIFLRASHTCDFLRCAALQRYEAHRPVLVVLSLALRPSSCSMTSRQLAISSSCQPL